MIFSKTVESVSRAGISRTALAVLCGVLLAIGFAGAEEENDKAAIPRPGAERMRREAQVRQARIAERRAAMDAAKARANAALAKAEGREVKVDEKGSEDAESTDEADKGVIPSEMTELLPVGAEFEGVRFPRYDEDRLTSVVNAEKMWRIDSEHLDLTKLVIDMLTPDGEIKTKIFMDRAVYDLSERKLISRSRATIEQKNDFVMTGDKMIFKTETQSGRMTGNVRTIIALKKTTQNSGGLLGNEKSQGAGNE